jgi:hypothetical protein
MHRRIFFGRVAVRHDDDHGNTGARSSVGERLTVVAARSRNYPGNGRPFAFEPLKVDKPAAHLESTDRRVVLVLHHNLHTSQHFEQRPGVFWRRRNACTHQRDYLLKLIERKHLGPRYGV